MKSYVVADRSAGTESDFLARLQALDQAGADVIQLRAKTLDDRESLDLARKCRDRIRRAAFFVNGRTDLALASGADGVHLPSKGLPVEAVRRLTDRLEIGRSCHSVRDVEAAAAEGADYVILGPVHGGRSASKSPRITLDDLRLAVAESVPVFAIGGFELGHLEGLRGTGVAGVAAITLFMRDEPLDEIIRRVAEVESA